MKVKLHIQLEPYNGHKFDYLEIEVEPQNIKKVYANLEAQFGKPGSI